MQHKQYTSPRRLRLGHLILAQVLSTLLIFTMSMLAGSAMAESAAKQYQIPPGLLKDALAQFGRDAQVMLSYSSEQISGLHSKGLNKTASVREGLEQLLVGTGLEAVVQDNGGYVLHKASPPTTGSTQGTLEEVRVSASKDPTTENTGSYTTSSTGASAKLPMSLRHTPQSVSVITRQRMDDQNLTQLQEVLEQTVGISVVQSGYVGSNWNTFQSRGFNIHNYLVDGLPLGSGGFELMSNDMAFYDRVEIVRGSTGLMMGIGSAGGSINYIRKKPTREFQASVTGQFGSWDNYRGAVDISTPLNVDGSVRGRMVAVKQDSGSHLDRYGMERDMLYGIVEADLSPSTLFTVGMEYQKHETHDSPEAGLPLFYSDGSHTQWKRSKNSGAKWASSDNERFTFFSSLEHFFDNDWRAKVQFNHARNGYDSVIGSGGSGSLDKTTGNGVELWAGRWQAKPIQNGLDVYASGPFSLGGRQHELVFGINYSHTEYTQPTYNDRGTGSTWRYLPVNDYMNWDGDIAKPDLTASGRSDFNSRQFGGYMTAKFKPTDRFSVLAGGRIIHWHRSTNDAGRSETGVVTPYLATTYDVTDNASIYASYTKIFNPQVSAMDRYGRYLDPEEGDSYEAGIKHALYGGRLNTSLAVFRVEQDNLAVQDGGFLTPMGGRASRAEQGTVTKGFEAEASGELAPGWQVSGGYTFRISQNSDGDKIQTVTPQNLFKLFTTYNLPGAWNKLTVGGGANWQSRIYTNNAGPNDERFTQGSYAIVNLMARYQVDEHFSVALNVNNLFDKVYYTNTAATMGFYGIPRNAMLTLKYQF